MSMKRLEKEADAAIADTLKLITATEKFLEKADKFRKRVEASIIKEQQHDILANYLNFKVKKMERSPPASGRTSGTTRQVISILSSSTLEC